MFNVFINSSKHKRIKATAKGMDGQIKLTTYTIPEHHKTHSFCVFCDVQQLASYRISDSRR